MSQKHLDSQIVVKNHTRAGWEMVLCIIQCLSRRQVYSAFKEAMKVLQKRQHWNENAKLWSSVPGPACWCIQSMSQDKGRMQESLAKGALSALKSRESVSARSKLWQGVREERFTEERKQCESFQNERLWGACEDPQATPLLQCEGARESCGVNIGRRVGGTGLKVWDLFLQAMEEISWVGAGSSKWFPFLSATVVTEHRKEQ